MSLQKIEASLRKRSGKGPARRLREQGLVPAVLYGQGIETAALSLDPRVLGKALSGPKRTNTVLELSIKGTDAPCCAMVKDHQYDPVSRQLLHVDLYAVKMDTKIKTEVPFTIKGRSAGEQLGGSLAKLFRWLFVECLFLDIPEAVTVDVTPLGVNDIMTAKDIPMPENVALLLDDKTPVVSVLAKKAETEAAEGGAGEAEEAAGDAAQETKEPSK